jgi:NAD(P)-dependent dehydrogenase (short-subunit alcohol dehydrogenase family)
VACDIDGDELEKTVSDLEGEGHIALAFDLSRPENCESLVAQTMERFGRLDI